MGQDQNRHGKYGGNCVSSKSHLQATPHCILLASYDHRGSPSLGKATPEGGAWGVRSKAVRIFYVLPYPNTARKVIMGQATTAANFPPVANILLICIPDDGHVHRLSGRGMFSEFNQSYQPMVAFHAPANGGHNSSPKHGP